MPLVKVPLTTIFPRVFSGDYTGFRVHYDEVEGWSFQQVWMGPAGMDYAILKELVAAPKHLSVAASGETFLVSMVDHLGALSCFGKFSAAVGENVVNFPNVDIPKFNTACFFNGQTILGGITPDASLPASLGSCGPAYLLWSGIGRLRFDPIKDRTAGFRPVPWLNKGHGTVWFVGQLGNGLFVMGDGGYGVLSPVSQGALSSYAFQQLGSVGMIRQGLIAGDYRGYLFINQHLDLVQVSAEGQATILGYKEFIAPLFENSASVNLSFEALNQRWFITNTERCFCLNNSGLFEVTQLITGIIQVGEFQFCSTFDELFERGWALTTSAMDFQQRGLKSIEVLEAGVQATSDFKAGVDYRYERGAWQEGPLITANKEGVTYPRTTATDFKLKVEGLDGFERLDYLKIRVKFSDRRNVRGLRNTE